MEIVGHESAHDYAFYAPVVLKHSKFAHFSAKNGFFLMFSGPKRHEYECKHSIPVHLSLDSYNANF